MARFTLRPFLRRIRSSSHTSTSKRSDSVSATSTSTAATSAIPSPGLPGSTGPSPQKSLSIADLREKRSAQNADIPELPLEHRLPPPVDNINTATGTSAGKHDDNPVERRPSLSETLVSSSAGPGAQLQKLDSDGQLPPPLHVDIDQLSNNPQLTLEQPTPDDYSTNPVDLAGIKASPDFHPPSADPHIDTPTDHTTTSTAHPHSNDELPTDFSLHRQQSLVDSTDAAVINTLIHNPTVADSSVVLPGISSSASSSMATSARRKIWVKRPGASATLVQIKEDDLVDDVRDMILRKYANSLGKTFDAPDMTLRIATRLVHGSARDERLLGPEEDMCHTIDTYYPGGQTVEEALLIDVPQKRTPKPSPRPYQHMSYHAMDEFRPAENGTDYFPPMPAVIQPTLPQTALPHTRDPHHNLAPEHPRSMAVVNTGQIPPIPSPGGVARRHRADREHRPKYGRQHTSSPTILSHNPTTGVSMPATHRSSNRPRNGSSASESVHANGVPVAPPLPSPAAPEAQPTAKTISTPSTPLGGAAPNTNRSARPRKTRRQTPDKATSLSRNRQEADVYPALPSISSMLDASVPPINVLIVEDNIINLRILEGLMKRLKVRWQTAMNGQIAVDKWRSGGYHLVLMDIQMPIMNGLQATKEIRRLERVNGIGVFSSSAPNSPAELDVATTNGRPGEKKEAVKHDPADDKLAMEEGLFKSPIIIVALTASSLQSDRHAALAAGCNDYLTKPVDFVWLERKVKEWGCMQALIDFDGWRKWKDFAAKADAGKTEEQRQKDRELEEKHKIKAEKMAKLQEKQKARQEELQREKERKKRESLQGADSVPGLAPEAAQETAAAAS
ncbi:unnamed protein product [Zymoseptoria tritici ST99CH_3D7]|uniref:Response regulatory domain-containing protein n=1 Tax=Zymoseptoria tritici (strain ST99CH_3D7) TaxID=1276538 RepID=A0A1X7RNW3_ZYMT9|nr:unnamed protein product [Zymoseptoria tritici ST99CH_3D7]